MKHLSLLLFLCLSVIAARAATVQGRIVDINDMSLDFVNAVLTSKTDPSAVYGSISDADGKFVIHNVPAGEYTLNISFIGYITEERTIVVKSISDQIRAGKFVLKEDSQMLAEVEVVGQASQMRFDIDKKVFNVVRTWHRAGIGIGNAREHTVGRRRQRRQRIAPQQQQRRGVD